MSIERSVRRAARRQDFDREQWADLDKIRYPLLVRTQPGGGPCVDPEPTARQWVNDPSFERTLELIGPTPVGGVGSPFWSEIPWWTGVNGAAWKLSPFEGPAARPWYSPVVAGPTSDRSFISTANPRSGNQHIRYHAEFGDSMMASYNWWLNYYPCDSQARIAADTGQRRGRQDPVIARVVSGQTVEMSMWVSIAATIPTPAHSVTFRGYSDNIDSGSSVLWSIQSPGLGADDFLPTGGYVNVRRTFTVPSGHGTHWLSVSFLVQFGVNETHVLDFDIDDWQVWTR